MNAIAVVLEQPERLALTRLDLAPAGEGDVVVDIDWTGISTGTERLLWSGRMPHFPGMGYPLVPGYESVGRVTASGSRSGRSVGERVFVPGANCFGNVRGLFGGAASRLVVPGSRVLPIRDDLAEQGILLALAATAHHAIAAGPGSYPDLVVGHGVLGRLIARLTVALSGSSPTVWERNPARAGGARDYVVIDPEVDQRQDYRAIYDVSGDARLLDRLIARLTKGGEIVLAGFYDEPLAFAFPPAFMREVRIRVAAEWAESDLVAVKEMVESGVLSFDGLITHRQDADQAEAAYQIAFSDPACLKMVLDWRGSA